MLRLSRGVGQDFCQSFLFVCQMLTSFGKVLLNVFCQNLPCISLLDPSYCFTYPFVKVALTIMGLVKYDLNLFLFRDKGLILRNLI